MFGAFYPRKCIVNKSSLEVLLLFQLPRCRQELSPSEVLKGLKYANCGQGLPILGLKYAIYGQRFHSFWASNMLISGQTLAGASRGLLEDATDERGHLQADSIEEKNLRRGKKRCVLS